jgi:hypothetical protein
MLALFSGGSRVTLRIAELAGGFTIREDGEVRTPAGRIRPLFYATKGYVLVRVAENKSYSIHRLLALAFIPNPDNKPEVNHIDGNKHNFILSNLEWVTRAENVQHAYRTGLKVGFHPSGIPLSEAHRKALCGSRWLADGRTYTIEGLPYRDLKEIAGHFKISRQGALNRCLSDKWPEWVVSKSDATWPRKKARGADRKRRSRAKEFSHLPTIERPWARQVAA